MLWLKKIKTIGILNLTPVANINKDESSKSLLKILNKVEPGLETFFLYHEKKKKIQEKVKKKSRQGTTNRQIACCTRRELWIK